MDIKNMKEMKYRLLKDLLLVRPDSQPDSVNGIIIPSFAQSTPSSGVVIASGPGEKLDNGGLNPMSVVVGDNIIWKEGDETEIRLDEEDLVLIAEQHILGVLEK